MKTLTQEDIIKACSVLFGPQTAVSRSFLYRLQPAEIKAVYRKRALENHPDRAHVLGKDAVLLSRLFRDVADSYKKIEAFLKGHYRILWSVHDSPGHARRTVVQKHKAGADLSQKKYKGRMPEIELQIGGFMYFSGIISMEELIKAVAWQYRQYPRIGQIAESFELLSAQNIRSILSSCAGQEKFGECAIRLGYLLPQHLSFLLARQQVLKPRLGSFFVQAGLVLPQEMEAIAKKQIKHNVLIQSKKHKTKLQNNQRNSD